MSESRYYTNGYECDICGSIHNRLNEVEDHISDKPNEEHNVDFIKNFISPKIYPIEPVLFESIYVINKHAKKHSEKATNSYHNDLKSKAKEHSNRKKALYSVKEKILEKIQQFSKRISIHKIRENDFYCLYFEDQKNKEWSFHTPCRSFNLKKEVKNEESERLEEFSKNSRVERTNRDLKESLNYLKNTHNINANKHLPGILFNNMCYQVNCRWNFL